MATTSRPSQYTYAISYGLLGGPVGGLQLRKAAQSAGLVPVPIATADIIIAHSAGCWLIPANSRPRLVIYIGMPLNIHPRQAWLAANHGRTLKGFLVSTYYLLCQPIRNLNIVRHPQIASPVVFKGVPAIFVANRDDPWPDLSQHPKFVDTHPWSYIGLSGTHDNLWEEPAKYVNIIMSYATKVLAETN